VFATDLCQRIYFTWLYSTEAQFKKLVIRPLFWTSQIYDSVMITLIPNALENYFGLAHLRHDILDPHPTPLLPVDEHLQAFATKVFASLPYTEELKIEWVVDFADFKSIFRTFKAARSSTEASGFDSTDEVFPRVFRLLDLVGQEIMDDSPEFPCPNSGLVFVPHHRERHA
jgi:hypothetical protein